MSSSTKSTRAEKLKKNNKSCALVTIPSALCRGLPGEVNFKVRRVAQCPLIRNRIHKTRTINEMPFYLLHHSHFYASFFMTSITRACLTACVHRATCFHFIYARCVRSLVLRRFRTAAAHCTVIRMYTMSPVSDVAHSR